MVTDVVGRFSTGSINHQLLFGIDLNWFDESIQQIIGSVQPIDLFDPDYGQSLVRGPVTSRGDRDTQINSLGIYIQDQITLADNLKLLLGGRFDTVKRTLKNFITNTETEQSSDAFSPRVGIVYQPIQPISLYASYNRSFNPVTGTSFGGTCFNPSAAPSMKWGSRQI